MKNKYYYGVIPLLLFALFAFVVMSCLMTGAKIYGKISDRDDTSFTMRTASQYLSVKVHETQEQNKIRVEEFYGVCSIVLPSQYQESEYETRLYCYDGYLCELFSPKGIKLSPKDGERVITLSELLAKTEDGILTLTLSAYGDEISVLNFYLRGSEEGVYEE